jgi:hypothetical protein
VTDADVLADQVPRLHTLVKPRSTTA